MSRFTTVASGLTAAGSSSIVGIKRVGIGDQRLIFQFRPTNVGSTLGPFSAKIFATLDYDFDVNTGEGFQEVTNVFGSDIQIDANQFFSEFANGIKKTEEAAAAFNNVTTPGFFQGPVGFFPAALFVQVNSISSGDILTVTAGV